ncbi:MAG: hypothetical protein ACK47B_00610 [Armatimonadota bacterium]
MDGKPDHLSERLPRLPGPYRSASIGAAVAAGWGLVFGGGLALLVGPPESRDELLVLSTIIMVIAFAFSVVGAMVGAATRNVLRDCPLVRLPSAGRWSGAQLGVAISWAAHAVLTMVGFVVVGSLTGQPVPAPVLAAQIMVLPVLTTPFFAGAGAITGHLIARHSA